MDCIVSVRNGSIPQQEIDAYIARAIEKFGVKPLSIDITIDGDDVELDYKLPTAHPFQRIRRITGYLVGTLDRFNNSKRAEEGDRIKHSTDS